jgi:hypothetical protein
MNLADSIRKHGFKRWYERQLGESVLWFVSCFLCMLTVAVCLEEFGARSMELQSVAMVIAAATAAGIGAASWRRFKFILARAEHIGDHATCAACGTYARFQVVGAPSAPDPMDESPETEMLRLRVRCRKCAHEWLIQ